MISAKTGRASPPKKVIQRVEEAECSNGENHTLTNSQKTDQIETSCTRCGLTWAEIDHDLNRRK